MYHNGLRYGRIAALVLFTHIVMLLAVLFRGNYETIQDLAPLTIAVLGLDVVYIIVLRFFYKQMTYTTDFLLLLILNISVIFQSCFGGIGFAAKHYITCIMALICCQIMFLLTRNHIRLMAIKKYLYIVLGVIMLAILLLTGSRSMWIQIGPISLQPSEFMKPVFVLLCATSIMEQHEKTKVLFFYVSKEALFLTGSFLAIFVLQWWCRDLGSLPTFAAAYGCAVICRICYPKAKFSKTTLIFLCAVGVLVVIAAAKFAPGYVQDRLSVDIWNDMYGNGYQQCCALMAIAEGGLFGKGPGYGNLIEIAAADTDIVFSTICEEWGFLVALLVIFFIASLLILPMINKPRSYYHTTMILGVAAVFVVQMGLNIFGSCNLIPFTGVTIPFISQGGTSMITCGLLAGMLKAGQSPTFRKPNVVSENTLSFKLPFRKEKEADELLSKHAPASNANKLQTFQQPANQNRTAPMQGGAPRQQARPTQPNPYGQPLNQTRTIPTNGTPRQQARPTQPNPYGQPLNQTRTIPTNGTPRQQARPTQPNPYGQPISQTRTIPTNGTPRQQARPTQPNSYGQPLNQTRTIPTNGTPRQQARPTQPNPYGQPLNQTRTIPTNGTPRQQARPTQPNPYGQPVNRTAPPNRSNNPYARPNTIQRSGSSQNEQTRMYRNNSEQGGSHNEKY